MVAIGAALAALAPTAKVIALQTAMNVGINVGSNLLENAVGKENAGMVTDVVKTVATGDTEALTEVGTEFLTGKVNQGLDRLLAENDLSQFPNIQSTLNAPAGRSLLEQAFQSLGTPNGGMLGAQAPVPPPVSQSVKPQDLLTPNRPGNADQSDKAYSQMYKY